MPPHFIDGEPHGHTATGRSAGASRGSRCASASAARSVRARPRWSPRCAAQLRDELSVAVLTNDIYTTEDADFLRRHAVLPDDRIAAVQTGGCPHTAIRDDITANLDAIEDLIAAQPDRLDLILVESGGDNLTATFSSGLVDVQIFVVDVAGGDKVPRKGGPGRDLLRPAGGQQDRPRPDGRRRPRRDAPGRRRGTGRPADGADLADR